MLFTPKKSDSSHGSRSSEDSFFKSRVQTKLAIGQPGDRYEVEADNTADKVVTRLKEPKTNGTEKPGFFSPKPVVQPKTQEAVQQKEEAGQDQEIQEKPLSDSITPLVQTSLLGEEPLQEKCAACEAEEQRQLVQTKCAECEAKEKEAQTTGQPVQQKCDKCAAEEVKAVQQKKESANQSGDISQQLSASKGGGSPMDKNTQSEMSQGFGADFSNVRVHTDSNAIQMNKALGSHAFTNGNDVYFNSGKYNPSSESGKHLLAHELTHTVQQGATPTGHTPELQTKLEEYEKPEHGKNTEGRLKNELEDRNGEAPPEPGEEPPSRKEKQDEINALEGSVKPRIDESAIQAPKAREEQAQAEEKIEKPEKLVEDKVPAEPEAPQEKAPTIETVIQQFQAEAQNSSTQIEQVPTPEEPEEVKAPEVTLLNDADGNPITPDREGDLAHARLLAQISEIRMQGHLMKEQGTNYKRTGLGMQEKVNTLLGRVGEGEKTIGEMNEAVTARRDAIEQGKDGLKVSEEKQTKFEQEAPTFKEKVDSTKSDSEEVVTEGRSVKSENDATKPEDPEDRGNSDKAGGQLEEVNQSTESIDATLGTVQSDLNKAIEQNTAAKQQNSESGEKLNETTQKLDQADAHIAMLDETNRVAKADIESRRNEPQVMQAQADEMIDSGESAIGESFRMEAELAVIEEKHNNQLKSVKSEEATQQGDTYIQRSPVGGDYAEPGRLNVFGSTDINDFNPSNAVANALTDRRSQEIKRIQDQRRSEIENLTSSTERPISEMSRMERVGLGLRMLGNRFLDWAASINMLDLTLFTINMINPLTYVLGVVSGLGLVINGTYNFFRDLFQGNIFGAIKSAGDAATGVAVIAGSITGLAMLISLAVTVAMFFGVGLAIGPVILPLMAKIMAFCGPIAFWAGITAAALNVISGIKSLIDLGSAQTAEELQGHVNDLQSDATNTLTSLLMAFAGRAGGRAGTPGTGVPVTAGGGTVLLGEFGTNIADRIAAFVGMREPAYAGASGGMAPVVRPQTVPGTSGGTVVVPNPGTLVGPTVAAGAGASTAATTRRHANQTCDNDVLDNLQREKDALCNSIPTPSCSDGLAKLKKGKPLKGNSAGLTRAHIAARIAHVKRCIEKRQEIQDTCFGGLPDEVHEKAIKELQDGIDRCTELLNLADSLPDDKKQKLLPDNW